MNYQEALSKLIKYFNPIQRPSGEYADQFHRSISKFPENIIQRAYEHCIDFDTRFPTIGGFRAYCYHFHEEAEAERHRQQMINDRKTADAIFKDNPGQSDYNKACFTNIKLALTGQITKNQFVETSKLLKINITPFLQNCERLGVDMDKPIVPVVSRRGKFKEIYSE